MNESFALNSETFEFHLKKKKKKEVFRQRKKGYTYTGGEIKSDLPPAPENEDSNKFSSVLKQEQSVTQPQDEE